MKLIPTAKPSMPHYDEFIKEVEELWETRWLTNTGPKHQELEKRLRTYLEVDHVDLFVNGHLALELAIEALGLKGEVITTPFTFASTTQAIVRNHLTPVFCDINEDDFTMDVDRIESLITEKTSAIVPVHVYGNVCDVHRIEELARKHNLKVIYDAAHAFGVKVNDIAVGNFGDISMFSFHATKVFHTVEGGGLTYKDAGFSQMFARLRQFGMEGKEEVPGIGTNAKMTEMHAAIGLCNLRHVAKELEKRRGVYHRYMELLADVPGIILPELQKGVTPNYSYLPVLVDEKSFGRSRDETADFLAEHQILARKYFYPLTSEFAAYQGLFEIQQTPVAKEVSERVLTLPLFADMEPGEVEIVCKVLRSGS